VTSVGETTARRASGAPDSSQRAVRAFVLVLGLDRLARRAHPARGDSPLSSWAANVRHRTALSNAEAVRVFADYAPSPPTW